jgi:hypothetical protein
MQAPTAAPSAGVQDEQLGLHSRQQPLRDATNTASIASPSLAVPPQVPKHVSTQATPQPQHQAAFAQTPTLGGSHTPVDTSSRPPRAAASTMSAAEVHQMQAQAQSGALSEAARTKLLSHWLFADNADSGAAKGSVMPRKGQGLAARTDDSRPFVLCRRSAVKESAVQGAHNTTDSNAVSSAAASLFATGRTIPQQPALSATVQPPGPRAAQNAGASSVVQCAAASLFSSGRDIPRQPDSSITIPEHDTVKSGGGVAGPAVEMSAPVAVGPDSIIVMARRTSAVPKAARVVTRHDGANSEAEMEGPKAAGRAGLKQNSEPFAKADDVENLRTTPMLKWDDAATETLRKVPRSGGVTPVAGGGMRESGMAGGGTASKAALRRFSCPRVQQPAATTDVRAALETSGVREAQETAAVGAAQDTTHAGSRGSVAVATGGECTAAIDATRAGPGEGSTEAAVATGGKPAEAPEPACGGDSDTRRSGVVGSTGALDGADIGGAQVAGECEVASGARATVSGVQRGHTAARTGIMVDSGWATGMGRSVAVNRRELAQVRLRQARRTAMYKEEE